MKKKIMIGIIIVVLVITAVALGVKSCTRITASDAEGYVQANLDLIFQGEIQGAQNYVDGSKANLEAVYQNGIQTFVENYLTGGVDTNGMYEATYEALTEKIFATMKYNVIKAEKKSNGTYEVTVQYRPADVFTTFLPELQAEAAKIEEDAKNGAYEGSEEEAQEMMMADYMSHSYALLESAYLDMKYGEKEEVQFTVTQTKGKPGMKEAEISTFIEKILNLDEIALAF